MRWMVRTTKKRTNANFLKWLNQPWNSEAKGYSPDSWETFVHGDLSYSKTASRDREDMGREFKFTEHFQRNLREVYLTRTPATGCALETRDYRWHNVYDIELLNVYGSTNHGATDRKSSATTLRNRGA